jgi:hypothetical protein
MLEMRPMCLQTRIFKFHLVCKGATIQPERCFLRNLLWLPSVSGEVRIVFANFATHAQQSAGVRSGYRGGQISLEIILSPNTRRSGVMETRAVGEVTPSCWAILPSLKCPVKGYRTTPQ